MSEIITRQAGYLGSKTDPSERDSYRSPLYLFRWANHIIGGIDFDTACTYENALTDPVWADEDTENAFEVQWYGGCWCNPPYSDIATWVDYAISQKKAITAMLIPSPNGETYYDRLCANAHEIHIVGRIAFIGADGKPKSGNNRGSSLFIINGYGQGSRSIVYRDHLIERYGKTVTLSEWGSNE